MVKFLTILVATLVLTANEVASNLTHNTRFGQIHSLSTRALDEKYPVVDLGSAGKYKGILQNKGKVHAYKGIPYAQPPVDDLRFKPPQALKLTAEEQKKVVDVTDDALRCVQFGTEKNIYGVKAGPGQEDCLKLWIYKPSSAKKGDSLPVHILIHGGALQYSTAPNYDFSDWVAEDQKFISVHIQYRLGAFGFMASQELLDESGSEGVNAALLDMRMALKWVQDNIAEFGGDRTEVTISGQSGGGLATTCQLAMYDGKEEDQLFKRAIVRSAQRAPTFTVDELKERNDKLAELLKCDSNAKQIECFRKASPKEFVDAVIDLRKQFPEMDYAGFVPTIDGITLTDSVSGLLNAGKFLKVPLITGYASHEGGKSITSDSKLTSKIIDKTLNSTNMEYALSLYPVDEEDGDRSGTGKYFISNRMAKVQASGFYGEPSISGSERLLARSFSQNASPNQTWSFRFDAPTVGRTTANNKNPLVTHSADNSYLQNTTSSMADYEVAVAREFRAYLSSFIRTGDPNEDKLDYSKEWNAYGDSDTAVRLVPAFDSSSKGKATGTKLEKTPKSQKDRIDWWQSDDILDQTKM